MTTRQRLLALGLVILCVATLTAAEKPNIVLILADDLGYECIGANGSSSYKTPNLDKLASNGMRFEHCYAQPLCTPTRVQLMTGLYNVRNYTRFAHLDPGQVTFAHLFKKAGYATGIVGKWQLAGGLEAPKHFGFDESFLWQLNRRPPRYANPGFEIDGRQQDYSNGEYGPDLMDRFAREFITRHKDHPFLLYYPLTLTHAPFQPTPDSKDWNPKAVGEQVNNKPAHFADMVFYMDKLIGQLVAELERHSLLERTFILFVGDNGTGGRITSRMGSQTVRGGKGLAKITGMHVPLIAHWPKTIPAGKVSSDLVDTTDFLPTLCEAAAIELPSSLKPDGQSFLSQLRGEKGHPRDWIYCWYARDGGATAQQEFAANQRFKLYRDGRMFDLSNDTEEAKPMAVDGLSEEAGQSRIRLLNALARFKEARPSRLSAEAGKGAARDE